MKRLAVLLALAGTCLGLGLPAHAGPGDSGALAGTLTYAKPLTAEPSANSWVYQATGAGTLTLDSDPRGSYTGPLSMVLSGISSNESTAGGNGVVEVTQLRGQSLTDDSSIQLADSIRVPYTRIPGSPIVIPVGGWFCVWAGPYGWVCGYLCVKVTIYYSVYPTTGAGAFLSPC